MKRWVWIIMLSIAVSGQCWAQEGIKWSYESPPGWDMLEPDYGFPTPIKQALMDNVRGHSRYSEEYLTVFKDPFKFKPWFLECLRQRLGMHQGLYDASIEASEKMSNIGAIRDASEFRRKSLEDFRNIERTKRQISLVEAWEPKPIGSQDPLKTKKRKR